MVDTKDLKNVAVFKGLDAKELGEVAKICEERKFRKDELVIFQDSIENNLNIIQKGVLEVEAKMPGFRDKDLVKVCSLTAKKMFGELGFIDGQPCSTNVRCSKDAVLITLHKADFDKLVAENPHIEQIVMKNLAMLISQRLRETTAYLRETILRLPSRIVSRAARAVFTEISNYFEAL